MFVIGICDAFGPLCTGHIGPGIEAESMTGGILWAPWHSHSPGRPCNADGRIEVEPNKRGNILPSSEHVLHPDSINIKPLAKAREAKRRRSMGNSSSSDSSENHF